MLDFFFHRHNSLIILFDPFTKWQILDQSKLKVFADHKMNVNQKSKFDVERGENIMGKGENPGYQYFPLYYNVFHLGLFLRVVKSWDLW